MTRSKFIIFYLYISLSFLSAEILVPLNDGAPLEVENGGEKVIFRNPSGDYFFLYIKEDSFALKVSTDGGASFISAPVDLKERAFSSIGNLTLYNNFDQGVWCFFTARENDRFGLFALNEVDGVLSMAFSGSFASPELVGEIASFEVHPDHQGNMVVPYVQAGALGVTTIVSGVPDDFFVVADSFKVDAFSFRESFKDGELFHYGTYSGADGLFYFDMEQGALNNHLEVFSGGVSGDFQVQVDGQGTPYLFYLSGEKIFGKKLAGQLWSPLNGGEALTKTAGAQQLAVFNQNDNFFLYYSINSNPYLSVINSSDQLVQANNGDALFPFQVDDVGMLPVTSQSLLFTLIPEGSPAVLIKEYNFVTDSVKDYPAALPAGSPVIEAAVLRSYLRGVFAHVLREDKSYSILSWNPSTGTMDVKYQGSREDLPEASPLTVKLSEFDGVIVDLQTGDSASFSYTGKQVFDRKIVLYTDAGKVYAVLLDQEV